MTYKLHRIGQIEVTEGEARGGCHIFGLHAVIHIGPWHRCHSLGKRLLLLALSALGRGSILILNCASLSVVISSSGVLGISVHFC